MNVIFGYKTMPEWHKNNLKNYYIWKLCNKQQACTTCCC